MNGTICPSAIEVDARHDTIAFMGTIVAKRPLNSEVDARHALNISDDASRGSRFLVLIIDDLRKWRAVNQNLDGDLWNIWYDRHLAQSWVEDES